MEWYFILLIVIGYIIVGAIIGGISASILGIDEEIVVDIVFFWPIFVPMLLLAGLVQFIINLFI